MRILLAAVLAFVLAPVLARAEGWQTSSAEAQGMSSRELAGLVEFGIANGMDSVLVVRQTPTSPCMSTGSRPSSIG